MTASASTETSGRQEINRRSFLYATTAAIGTMGAATAAWPLIDQMNPDARVRAADDLIEVDLAKLQPAEQRVVRWKNLPIFVANRTPAMLQALQDNTLVARLIDADSQTRQQPSYAKNWHRSIDPDYAVLVGVCTYIGCIPTYFEKTTPFSMAGGYLCPCCAAHYDSAGRARAGAPANTILRFHRTFLTSRQKSCWARIHWMSFLQSNPLSGFRTVMRTRREIPGTATTSRRSCNGRSPPAFCWRVFCCLLSFARCATGA
jgi:ubiquinol-cytochrome c reductase iron-sulfur subunit